MLERIAGAGRRILGVVRRPPAPAVLVACAALLFPAAAAASPLPELAQFPESGRRGNGANELAGNGQIATDPANGHVYVLSGSRVNEFTAWGEFVKAWGWGVRDGSPELQVCGPAEPEPFPPASLCQAAIPGSGPGQIESAAGIAVDSAGDVYVVEPGELLTGNLRVQKFNSAGEFVLMFGGEVDKTTGADVCTAASGDECGIGVAGTADGWFSFLEHFVDGSLIAAGNDGTVYVGDLNRIQEFEPDGTFKRQIPIPMEGPGANGVPNALAFDPASESLYFDYTNISFPRLPVYKLDPTNGNVLRTTTIEAPGVNGKTEGLATDAAGDLFVIFEQPGSAEPKEEARVLEYGPGGEQLIDFDAAFASPPLAPVRGAASSLQGMATNAIGDLYVGQANGKPGYEGALIKVYGPPPDAYGPPPALPPVIGEQFASSVETTSATVRAKINPRFWADTRYYVEYGTAPCSEGGCQAHPTPPGSKLTENVVNAPLLSPAVQLTGLAPGTTYHYRFVAASSGGGPVAGQSGRSGAEAEATFTTSSPPAPQPPCPENQAFRPGPGAFLPDCRAYEMVSPVDKNGADVSVVFNSLGDPAGLDQAAADGESLTYSAYRAFGQVESSPYTSQYLATRIPGVGWSSRGISPPREGPSLYTGAQLDSQYKAFTADLCSGWLLQDSDIPLASGWTSGWPNVYRRDLCAGGYQALAPLRAPALSQVNEFTPEVQGFSADGSRTIFAAAGQLANNAVQASQLYEMIGGLLRLVCILPDGTPAKEGCSAGMGHSIHANRGADVSHAISEDGSTIYWTEASQGPGKLFARLNHKTTIAVDEGEAEFWAAAAEGSRAIYSDSGQLFEFDLASQASTPIAGGFEGVLGVSEDASRVYFASSEAIAAAGANPRGAEPAAGQPNLYLYEAGESPRLRFVATLSSADVTNTNVTPSDTAPWPIRHVSHVSSDGAALAFMSTASLTGYDNRDVETAEADSEVYVYRAGPGTLDCVSCLPTGARPSGVRLKGGLPAAAQLPAAESQLHTPHVLADSGSRLFFESFDALSPRDVNSKQDVYEWEAPGAGNCSAAAPGFDASFGGCVNLISSGESGQGSEIVDASSEGRDVFFKTDSSLLPQDPGLIDIYDAREGGGFPVQRPPAPGCQGEACQSPAAPPSDSTPASQIYQGPGNVKPAARPNCPRGKHAVKKKGRWRCVKSKKKRVRHHKHRHHVHGHHGKKHKHGHQQRKKSRHNGRYSR